MPLTAAASLLDALRVHQLLRPAQIDELTREGSDRFAEARALAQHLLERGWVTPFQINQILQERGAELILGPYLLIERLGEGFGGTLFKARHQRMNRIVALRLVRKELLADPQAIQQFYGQVEAASKLDHDNVVHAYDAGPIGETHFLATEYIAGTDLGRLVKQSGPLSVPDACSCIYQAALGLQHGFAHGLVHHGLKPSKLMVLHAQGGQAVGVVKVIELGLTQLRRLPGATEVAEAAAYQAPEQAVDSHTADIRADIYSLGAVFAHLLTGQAPVAGAPVLQNAGGDVPPGVTAILQRMLAPVAADRYATPAEVSQALQEFAPAAAPPDNVDLVNSPGHMLGSTVNLLPREARLPKRTLAAEGLRWALLVAVGGTLLVAGFFVCRTFLFPDARARNQPVSTMPEPPPREWLNPVNLRPEELTIAGRQPDLVAVLRAGTNPVRTVRFHPRGTFVAAGDEDGLLHLWDWNTGKETASWDAHGKPVLSLAWSPDGQTLASGGKDKKGKLWDASTRREKQWWPSQTELVSFLAFTPDNQHLAGRFAAKEVRMIELATGKDRHFLKGGSKTLNALVISPDGKIMVLGAQEKSLYFFDLPAAKRTVTLETPHGGPVRALAFSGDSKLLASAGDDKTVKLWELAGTTPTERAILTGHKNPVVALAFAPDSQMLASAASDGHVILWRAAEKVTVGEWHLPAAVHDMAIAPDGRHLVVATAKGAVYVFRLPSAAGVESR